MADPLEWLRGRELEVLRRLRQRFLANEAGGGYWTDAEELALYDRTFGQRIAWKWEAVLQELTLRGWRPTSTNLVDWGCGSGVASRRVLAHWPGQRAEVTLHDSSTLARDWAGKEVARRFPEVTVRQGDQLPAESLVLLSHVLNELTAKQLAELVERLRLVREFIWVESGTHENSRRLGAEVREKLVQSGEFAVVAPCPHARRCGMLAPGNERHWCHSFVPAPREIFQDAGWMQLGRELGIDLRSTPYAFLALRRVAAPEATETADRTPPEAARMIGRPRDYKGYSLVLSCEPGRVQERMLQKRDAPALLKEVQRLPEAPIYQWKLEREKIVGGEAVFVAPER